MKIHWISSFLVCVAFSCVTAQDLKVGDSLLVEPKQVSDVKKAEGLLQEPAAEVHDQDTATLESKRLVANTDEEIPEMDSLREKSVYYVVASGEGVSVSSIQSDRLGNDLQQVSALYRMAGQHDTDCMRISLSVRQRVKRDPDTLLQIVDVELRANPGCSCEIVKAAISESDLEVATVLEIVKVAFQASPANMRLIAQCAIAACPDALSDIQNLLAKYEKGTSEGNSAKSAKDADVANLSDDERAALLSENEVGAIPNPLDFPGGPTGQNIIFVPPTLFVSPPQTITRVDP